jgi:hypothetical protein
MPELNVRKGSSVDTLSPFGAVSLKGDIKTAAQLRAELKLQKVMVDADVSGRALGYAALHLRSNLND